MGLQLLRTLPTYLLKQNLYKIGFSLVLGVVAIPKEAEAQVVPDGTLKSTVETIQELMKIDGGLTEGSNLFHSFEEFNIPEGMEASFENALEIENIFTRVTGDSASNINGILSAQGGANLFLMNPHGIVFGQNASINIGGSFIATTADNIQFQDGTEFAATGTEDQTPLLTNEIPIGLGFGSNSGAIEVKNKGNQDITASPLDPTVVEVNQPGLEVASDKTLGLIGGNITIDGSILEAKYGNIELGSVGSGTVDIQQTNNNIAFDYSGVTNYQDITLKNFSLINADSQGQERIALTGRDINLLDGSFILSQSQDNATTSEINLQASESINLAGTSPDGETSSSIRSEILQTGQTPGASVTVSADKLSIEDAGRIQTATYSDSDNATGANVNVQIDDGITINNGFIASTTFGDAKAGDLNLLTSQLQLANFGTITSSAFQKGNGGDVVINADLIEVIGVSEPSIERTTISASSFSNSQENGNAGNITINTDRLFVTDGASVSSSSFAFGNAGSLNINASKLIEVSGKNEQFLGSSPQSTIRTAVRATTQVGQETPGFPDVPSGDAGTLSINTSSLNISNEATVGVENQGSGEAGTLSINAEDVSLDNNTAITATSASGTSGNVEINTDGLQIDNESTIAAEAGNQGGGGNININAENITAKKNSDISANAEGGDGGNITIDTETLLGLDNSDITANAVEGDGGNINITATSILGFEERPELTPLSDITASSEFGVDGNININSPETNAEEDVQVSAKKPVAPLTPLEFVKGCQLPEGILTTRGRGVPESPYPFPFGRFSYDEDVYKKAEETMRQERLRQQRSERENGISKREAEERRQERELAMLREKQRLLPNRHAHLKYEVTDDREVGSMLLPAPQGRLVGDPDGRTDKNAIPIFYSQSNELPPISREKRLRQEGNVLVINPDGSKHFVRMFLMSHPTEEMCQSTVGSR